MNTNIFREYDIRGIVPEDIDAKIAFKIGQSFASYIEDKNVVIAYDNRLSSPMIHKNLVKGLTKCGAHVIDLGLCTTPMYYIIKKHLNIENGIMITASHNPKEYNGFKISFNIIGPAFGDDIFAFRDFTIKENFTKAKGSYEIFKDTEQIYLETIKNAIDIGPKKIKAVFDPGNGTSSVIIHKVLQMFEDKIEYKVINGESDGTFPVHHPDPSVEENMVYLKNEIATEGFDIGIGIDGDGDRVGVVDNEGNFISSDKMMLIIYRYLFPFMKNKKAIMDVKCSKIIYDELQNLGLETTTYKAGNSYMNHKINSEDYDFGGEFSGHLWFRDKWPGVDDGLYASLRIIEMLSNLDIPLSSLLKNVPISYTTPEIKIPVSDEQKATVTRKVKEYFIDNEIDFIDVDGIRVNFPDGFVTIRKSNTTPNITMRVEKSSQEELEIAKEEYIRLINSFISDDKQS